MDCLLGPGYCLGIDACQQQLRQWVAAPGTPQQVALRCRIVLAPAEGQSHWAMARQVSINRKTVVWWRTRLADQRLDSLWKIAPGRGRQPTDASENVAALVEATVHTKPTGMPQWRCRTMATCQGVSTSTVNTIWPAHHLQPHRVATCKLSQAPKYLEQLTDVVGLYLTPPQQAMGLCGDEKSQLQAFDRTPPGLPLKKGRCGTMPHDDQRHGTTTFVAALEILRGQVIGQCVQRPRQQEFLKCLRTLNKAFPGGRPLPVIMDNDGTHQHENVRTWFTRHPRFVPHVAQIVFERHAIASGSTADRVGFPARLNFGAQSRFSRARTNFQPGTDNYISYTVSRRNRIMMLSLCKHSHPTPLLTLSTTPGHHDDQAHGVIQQNPIVYDWSLQRFQREWNYAATSMSKIRRAYNFTAL